MDRPGTLFEKILRIKSETNKQDKRNYYFIAVIDCIINQNVRDTGAASFPAMNWELVQLCNQYNVGIMQMPCPEIAFLGFAGMKI